MRGINGYDLALYTTYSRWVEFDHNPYLNSTIQAGNTLYNINVTIIKDNVDKGHDL